MEKASNKKAILLALILLFSLFIRVPGLFWGYNLFGDGKHYVLEPDEWHHTAVVEEFLKGVDHDSIYVKGYGGQVAAVLWLLGKFDKSVTSGPKYLHATARLISLFYALATIYLVYFFSQELFEGQIIALLSSLFFGFSWIHVAFARIGVPDSANLFWIYLSLYFILRFIRSRDDLDLVLASISAGFAMGIKLAVIPLLPLFFILVTSHRKIYHSLLVGFVLMGSFEFINGFSYTPKNFYDSRYMVLVDSFSGVKMNKLINVPSYLLLTLIGVGLPIFLLSVWGMFKFIRKNGWKKGKLNLMLQNKYFLVITPMFLHFYLICKVIISVTRFVLPFVPLLAIFAAYGLVGIAQKHPKLFKGLLAGIVIYQLVQIVSLEKATIFDSRKLMGEWMLKNLPPNAVIYKTEKDIFTRLPSSFNTTNQQDANYIVLHSSFYSRYLTGGYGFRNRYPESCQEIVHCRGRDKMREFIQKLFKGETEYVQAKKFEMDFITPEMLLIKYVFGGPRTDGYGSFAGDTVLFKRKDS